MVHKYCTFHFTGQHSNGKYEGVVTLVTIISMYFEVLYSNKSSYHASQYNTVISVSRYGTALPDLARELVLLGVYTLDQS